MEACNECTETMERERMEARLDGMKDTFISDIKEMNACLDHIVGMDNYTTNSGKACAAKAIGDAIKEKCRLAVRLGLFTKDAAAEKLTLMGLDADVLDW
jgi:hypothetical protein